MSGSLKDIFEKLKKENVIKGEYSDLESYFDSKIENSFNEDNNAQEKIKADFIKFSRELASEQNNIKQKYFKNEYHTIDRWIQNYLLVKEYYKEHGTLITKVGEVYKIHGFSLKIDEWLMRQRTLRRNDQLRENQIKLLDRMKMDWDFNRKLYKDESENKQNPKMSA